MTPDADHRECRFLLGAYLLGSLDGADRVRLEHHLAECRECERELARLAPVTAMLARLRGGGGPAVVEPLPPDLLPTLIERSRRERRALHRRTALATLIAAVAVITAVVVAFVVPRSVPPPERPAGATVALRAAAGYPTTGSATLTAHPWGTAISLRLAAMPPQGPFRLEVAGTDGPSQVAATWHETSTGAVVVAGATALAPREIRLIRVVGTHGTVLTGRPGGG